MGNGTEMSLTAERLREVLNYDPETGVFTWRVARPKCRVGAVTGYLTPIGYRTIKIDRERYYAHRLAWLYVYGKWPTGEVDHRSGKKDDNRIKELRETTPALNQQNRHRANTGNRSSFLGVRLMGLKFQARIKLNGKHIHLGTYSTAAEASEKYLAAKAIYHPYASLTEGAA